MSTNTTAASKKNKGTPKSSSSKIMKMVQTKLDEVSHVWSKRFEALAKETRNAVTRLMENITALDGRTQTHSDVLEQLDMSRQVLFFMMLEVLSRLEQTDHHLYDLGRSSDQLDLDAVQTEAKNNFDRLVSEAIKQAKEDRERVLEERRAEIQAAKEKEIAEREMQKAETEVDATPGGPGTEIPEGAEVFGD